MRLNASLFLVLCVTVTAFSQGSTQSMRISGFVRDFENRPIDSANVMLLNRSFQPVAQSTTDFAGHYSVLVDRAGYHALIAVKTSEYAKSRLEYWAWNIPPAESLSINPRYHRLEVYGMNAFSVQGSGSRTVFVFFRPMSLTRSIQWQSLHDSAGTAMETISPRLSVKDVVVAIDGEPSAILDLTEVREKTKTGFMRGYLMQCALSEKKKSAGVSRIVVTVTDSENHDVGEALLFWNRE
jgi:hypothetical protein